VQNPFTSLANISYLSKTQFLGLSCTFTWLLCRSSYFIVCPPFLSFLFHSPSYNFRLSHNPTAPLCHGGALGERRYSSYPFSTSALEGGERSASRPSCAFSPGESTPSTYCTGGWLGPRAGLDIEATGKSFCLCWGSNLDRPVVQPVARHYTD
jgi:hypothetical protein